MGGDEWGHPTRCEEHAPGQGHGPAMQGGVTVEGFVRGRNHDQQEQSWGDQADEQDGQCLCGKQRLYLATRRAEGHAGADFRNSCCHAEPEQAEDAACGAAVGLFWSPEGRAWVESRPVRARTLGLSGEFVMDTADCD
jgi:hypothetical protein